MNAIEYRILHYLKIVYPQISYSMNKFTNDEIINILISWVD